MSKKVLKGFYEEDAEKDTEFYRGIKHCPAHIIEISKEVPVRLASESVDLKWLREEIERFYFNNPEMEGAKITLKYLLLMAEKEAKKK